MSKRVKHIAVLVLPDQQSEIDNVAMNIGNVIKIMRLQRKMTQEQVALEADMATSNVSRIEKGQRQPSQKVLLKIAKALNTKPSTIYAACEHPILDPAELLQREDTDSINETNHLLLSNETHTVIKLFNELTPANKLLMTELLKTVHRNQEKNLEDPLSLVKNFKVPSQLK